METTTRNATLTDLATLLKDQHARKVDVVAQATSITSVNGNLQITGTEPEITDAGVTMADGTYTPTGVCDEGIADKLRIPITYLRRLRTDRPDLYDQNVNGWLHGNEYDPYTLAAVESKVAPDHRKFLIRCFRGDEGNGIARAFLSDSYKMIDHLDCLTAALEGIDDAGINVTIDGCDLTDRRMYLRLVAPEVTAMAHTLLKDYRNPFGEDFEQWRSVADREGLGYGDGTEPIVWAGLVLSNSETGNGAWSIVPRATIKVCKNGLTITKDAMREVHLGGKLEEGTVNWSDDTQRKSVDLLRAKTRDAVQTFLSADYLNGVVARLEERAAEPVENFTAVKVMTKPLAFSPKQMDGILNRFIKGGQMNRAGVVNAITAHAQEVGDADVAADMEAKATGLLV